MNNVSSPLIFERFQSKRPQNCAPGDGCGNMDVVLQQHLAVKPLDHHKLSLRKGFLAGAAPFASSCVPAGVSVVPWRIANVQTSLLLDKRRKTQGMHFQKVTTRTDQKGKSTAL